MPHAIAAHKQRLLRLPLAELIQTAGPFLQPPDTPAVRVRAFTPWTTFWLFLSQVLGPAPTCKEALRHGQVWLRGQVGRELSSNTSAYCQARQRLPQACVEAALASTIVHARTREIVPAIGRPVRVVDGSSCSMPDTAPNQNRYPQPRRQKAGCGFPVMRFVGVFSLTSGALLGVAQDELSVHERTLWRRLWDRLVRDDIVLGDRGFCGYADYYVLLQRGVDSVMRLHQRRKKGVRKIKRLGKDDWLVEWIKTKIRPQWMAMDQWKQMPAQLRVRHVRIRVAIPGFRTRSFVVATTLLDASAYPAPMLAELYRQRWRVELFFRDIKITMGMDVLRCKTPALIHKEFSMHLIAYNLVRAFMLEAAQQYAQDPLRLSFAGAIATLRQWAPMFPALRTTRQRRDALRTCLRCIAQDLLSHRPDRVEPRARKRRPKNYQLLNKPRRQFKEIQHRNRYTKTLS